MKIEHIALYVQSLEKTKEFYEKYFSAYSSKIYKNSKGFSSYFLMFDDGARLEIMSMDNLNKRSEALSFGYAHIAMSVGTAGDVDTLTRRLESDGYNVLSNPRTTGDGYYESVVLDPDGNLVEITV